MQRIARWGMGNPMQTLRSSRCKEQCRPHGSDPLPKGIISAASNLEMRPLWGFPKKKKNGRAAKSLLAMAVGVRQKETVNKIVKKVGHMKMIHTFSLQWFAKRFLHPDIVAEYDYIFLWDEDLGVDNFRPGRYLSIVKDEGLEISQPALDPAKSLEFRDVGGQDSRQILEFKPLQWVEMMAPVFSRAAWRCAWYMIQGDRSKNVGVVDAEYIVHEAIPTLGGPDENKVVDDSPARSWVRRQSFVELEIFKGRWERSMKDDECWIDPYPQPAKTSQQLHSYGVLDPCEVHDMTICRIDSETHHRFFPQRNMHIINLPCCIVL
ncbi:hypothetical protein ACLOJK_001752 [Asimina triloba]